MLSYTQTNGNLNYYKKFEEYCFVLYLQLSYNAYKDQ